MFRVCLKNIGEARNVTLLIYHRNNRDFYDIQLSTGMHELEVEKKMVFMMSIGLRSQIILLYMAELV